MRRLPFHTLLVQLGALTSRQRDAVLHALHATGNQARVVSTIESARAALLACPRCQCRAHRRHGHANGLQRFRCRACGRTFNCLSGTPLARLRHKAKWLDYCGTMLDPASTVRRAAGQVSVHKNTSFRWRHRMLTRVRDDRRLPLASIVEADEMYLPESEKGARKLSRPARRRGGAASRRGSSCEQVCVLVARDRDGRTHDAVTGKGPLSAAQLQRHLGPVLARDAMLVTDGHAAYRAFARATGLTHQYAHQYAHQYVKLRAGARVRGAVHVHNVNAYHSRLRGWLQHFRGVATHYLNNYCGWRWAIDLDRIASAEAMLRSAVGVIHT
jgi:transposase-like protein